VLLGGSNFTAGPAMVVDLSASKVGKYLLAPFSRPVWFPSPFILLGSRHRPHRTLATSRHHEQVLPILPTLQSHHLSCLAELCITHVIFGFRFRDYVPLPTHPFSMDSRKVSTARLPWRTNMIWLICTFNSNCGYQGAPSLRTAAG
jgi:hypothetical protein